jgi:hypothetical protein
MLFNEILSHITGFSVPIFGIQWAPPPSEVKVARDLIRELEDRRVFYRPDEQEGHTYCLHSVTEIRHMVTEALKSIDPKTQIGKNLTALRKACRQFCDTVGAPSFDSVPRPAQKAMLSNELAKFRRASGWEIGCIAIAYGLDVEDELATIIPFNFLPARA